PTIKPRLIPIQQLADGQKYHWQSLGEDPFFKFKSKRRFPVGWYMLSVRLTADCKRLNGKLYVDYGEGFNECESVALPMTCGQTLKRVCYFPRPPVALRFDPAERVCRFTVDALIMSKLTTRYARQLMRRKINSRQNGGLVGSLSDAALLERYDRCFTPFEAFEAYSQWLNHYEAGALAEAGIPFQAGQFARLPLISVLLPTYNSREGFLRECIESVLGQSYPHWELCIADDASTHPRVREVIREYAAGDGRIRFDFRPENGHISAASNSALALATGEYVALLDHDDRLAEHALLWVAKTLNENPEAKIIYSDEDKIDEHGRRYEPHFKSGWNRDLLYSQNYISHLGVYETRLIREVGGFRTGVEGSQDYDLLLRSVARVKDHQIVHIPHVLYHWRAIEGSTALEAGEKTYTTEAGIKALEHYFAEAGQTVSVEQGLIANTYRVRWPIPKQEPLVSLLIPTRDGYEILKQCVDSILAKTTYQNYEILILDNQTSCEKTLGYFRSFEQHDKVRVLAYDQPFNYSAINNYGVEHAKGSIIGLINNDIEVISPEWLTEMVSHTLREDVGCVGAKLYYANNTVQHAGVILGIGGVGGHSHKHFSRNETGYFSRLKLVQNYSAVTAAALLVRKDVLKEVNGLNEQDLTVAFNDVDFCLKVREAGYRNLWTPYAELYHHESVSRGAEDNPEKIARFKREIDYMVNTWQDKLTVDPFYSRNLTLDREDFSIRL
ncbi:MAG: glycosyltransferase family 2 protein, partial [Shewanella sp.]|nr:glycosyltransferase family 2 protein [Shewanella sp.]